MRSFVVGDVTASSSLLPATTLAHSLAKLVVGGVEASGANLANLVAAPGIPGVHPLLRAVHVAFADHRPLVLSPDEIWLCIAQGFALHVEANSEALRSRLVAHQGTCVLTVQRDDFVAGSPDNDWPGCFAAFSDQIAAHIGKKRDLLVAAFSTTGPVERAASEVVLMSAMRSYFAYRVTTLCGIPSVTLFGTPDDWRAVRQRAEVLAEFDLERWIAALLKVLDQFVAAADGNPDPEFWRSIYKEDGKSGGPYVTGWINTLFPYLEDDNVDPGNIAAALDPTRPAKFRPNQCAVVRPSRQPSRGPSLGEFPRGLSRVPFIWQYFDTELAMVFWGGFVGISQDPATAAVRPAIGWAVQRDEPAQRSR